MGTMATPQECDNNTLSNTVFKAEATEYSDTPNKNKVNCQVYREVKAAKSAKSEESQLLFRNLAFELPLPKRKNGISDREAAKKLRTESSDDDCGSGDDSNAKIFNYLTGTYESVEETDTVELVEDNLDNKDNILSFNGSTVIGEHTIVKADPIETLEVFDVECVGKSGSVGEHTTIEPKKDALINVEDIKENRLEFKLNSTVATSGGGETTSERSNLENKTLEDPLVKEDFDSDVAFNCFDCDTVFDDRSELETHASLIHSLSLFKCDLHYLSKDFTNKCSKCVYESVLRDSRKDVHKALEGDGDAQVCSVRKTVDLSGSSMSKESSDGFKEFSMDLIKPEQIRTLSPQATIEIDEENVRIGKNNGASEAHENFLMASSETENSDVISETKPQLNAIEDSRTGCDEILVCNGINEISVKNEPLPQVKLEVGSEFHYVPHKDTINDDCAKCCSRITLIDAEKRCTDCGRCGPGDIKCATVKIDEDNDGIDASEVIDIQEISIMANSETKENNDIISETRPQLDAVEDDNRFYSLDESCDEVIVPDVINEISEKRHYMPNQDTGDNDCVKCRFRITFSNVAKRCEDCGFPTNENNLCDVGLSLGDIKCFHCSYTTSHNRYLYYHAANHVLEDFSCDKPHTGVTNASSGMCFECIYEYYLRMAKENVVACKICGFKTVIVPLFDVHQCNKSCVAPYTCWDCKLDSFNTIEELREHAVVHYKSKFRCKVHGSAVNNCSQCLYQALADSLRCDFRSLSEESFDRNSAGNVSNSERRKFKCFHCKYQTYNKYHLKYHCKSLHFGGTFTCVAHPKSPKDGCLKCIYQNVLSLSQESLFECAQCNFSTSSELQYKFHKKVSHLKTSNSTSPSICFDCNRTFKHLRTLKHHALRHSNSKFSCTEHKSKQVPQCPKCTYEDIISTLRDTFTCKKCGYVTYVWSHMREHESDETHCKAYKAEHVAPSKSVASEPPVPYMCLDRGSKFQCDEHKTPYTDCPKCRYVQLGIASMRGRLGCYDCDKPELFVKLQDLHRHVAEQHPQSNFACTLHIEKKVNRCGKCLYSEIVKDVLGDNYVKLICWDCDGNKLFSRMTNYENHIVYLHLDSTFLCPEHCGRNYKRCSKCLYQKMLQRHSIVTPPPKPLNFQCLQCDYSDKRLDTFIRHVNSTHKNSRFKCQNHTGDYGNHEYCPQCFYSKVKSDEPGLIPFIRCYECNGTYRWPLDSLKELKKHIRNRHKKCSFVCTVHPSEGGINCMECNFEAVVQDAAQTNLFRYECFICNYGSKDLNLFKSHVYQSHKDAKYSCKRHLKGSVIDCAQCFYAAIVSEVSSSSIVCYACVKPTTPIPHINALREHIVDNHRTSAFICPNHIVKADHCDMCLFQRQLEIITEQQHASLHCPDCDYTTAKFSALRYHVWQEHRDSQYQCKQHVIKRINCDMCSYSTMIENLRKFTCYICETLPVFSGVDSLSSHIYKLHKNDLFVCPDDHSSSISVCAKCSFQKLVIAVFTLQCHDCHVALVFPDKDSLKLHKMECHSKIVCEFHPIGPNRNNCGQCYYKGLLRETKKARPTAARASFPNFECFNCNYETDKDVIMKWHIQKEHSGSKFTCGTHSSSEIDRSCSKCRYENLILQVKEHFVLSLSP